MQPWRLKPSSANHLSHNGHATLKAMRQCATQIVPESSETQFKRLCWCWSASCTALADSQTRRLAVALQVSGPSRLLGQAKCLGRPRHRSASSASKPPSAASARKPTTRPTRRLDHRPAFDTFTASLHQSHPGQPAHRSKRSQGETDYKESTAECSVCCLGHDSLNARP